MDNLANNYIGNTRTGVDFINCFAPYAYLLRFAPNFCASKMLLKSGAQSANSLAQGVNQFMKLTPGLIWILKG